MRKLIIFLYFVFLFKLAFAQSLPSFPGLRGEEPSDKMQLAQANPVPQLNNGTENDAALPADFDLPVSSGKVDETPTIVDKSTGPVPVVIAPNPDASVVTPPVPQIDMAATPSAAAPALPTVEGQNTPTLPVPAAPDITAPAVTAAAPAETNTGSNARSEFPATPALNFNEKSAQPATATATTAAPTPEQREKDVDTLLNQVFDQQKTKEEVAKEKAADEAEAKAAKEIKNTKQDDSPLAETVVNVDEKPVQPIDDLKNNNEQQDLADLPASLKKGKTEKSAKAGKEDKNILAETNFGTNNSTTSSVFNSTTYSESQLADLLVKASSEGNKQTVVQLLNSGRSPDSRNSYGETPLMVAIYNNKDEIVDLLLTAKANPNIADNKGNSALMVAAAKGNNAAAQKLIKAGSNIDQANNISDTPLLVSTLNGNINLVKLLVNQHANINKANADGLTPLHIAAYTGNADLVKYFLAAGANPNIVAHGGYKPYDLAKDKTPAAAEMILAYTATQTPKPVTVSPSVSTPQVAVATMAPVPVAAPSVPASAKTQVANLKINKPEPVKTAPVNELKVENLAAPVTAAPAPVAITPAPVNVAENEVKKPASLLYQESKTKWTKLSPDKTEAPAIAPAPVQKVEAITPTPAPVTAPAANVAPTMPTQQMAVTAEKKEVSVTKTVTAPASIAQNELPVETLAPVSASPAKPAQIVRVRYDDSGKRIDLAQQSSAPIPSPVAPAANIITPEKPAPVEIAAPAVPKPDFEQIKYERSSADMIANSNINTTAPAISKPDISTQIAKPASMSFDEKVIPAAANKTPAQLQTQLTATPQPLEIQPVVLTPAPINTASQNTTPAGNVSIPANLNIPKYAMLDSNKQAVWDNKLEEWVRNGISIDTQPQPQKTFWLKQEKVLQAVYENQFDMKVQLAKQKVAGGAYNNVSAPAQAAGVVVQSKPVKLSSEQLHSFKTSSAETGYENVFSINQ